MYTPMNEANHHFDFIGLSTDNKPSPVANGCIFLEMDTGEVFSFDAEHNEWIVFGGEE